MEKSINQEDPSCLKPGGSEFCCRICFEPESEEHKLISPCKCTGSMRYIHEDCLKIWLLSKDKDLSNSECDICKFKLKMSIVLATKCNCKNFWNECLGMFIFPILLILMCSILLVILLFLIQGIQNGTSSTGERTYLVLLLIACTIIIVIILIVFIKALKRGCCSSEMVDWNIESIVHEETVEFTVEHHVSNMTMVNDDLQVMVMPKFSRFGGRNIQRPEISTSKLVPIMRSGELVGYRQRNNDSRSLGASQVSNFSQISRVDFSFNAAESRVVPINDSKDASVNHSSEFSADN